MVGRSPTQLLLLRVQKSSVVQDRKSLERTQTKRWPVRSTNQTAHLYAHCFSSTAWRKDGFCTRRSPADPPWAEVREPKPEVDLCGSIFSTNHADRSTAAEVKSVCHGMTVSHCMRHVLCLGALRTTPTARSFSRLPAGLRPAASMPATRVNSDKYTQRYMHTAFRGRAKPTRRRLSQVYLVRWIGFQTIRHAACSGFFLGRCPCAEGIFRSQPECKNLPL